MRILFLVKFYQPFDRGGSEWSTHDLAKLLAKKGHKVSILTPNYGAHTNQIIEEINIFRFPFIKKLKNPKEAITPWWTNNLFWFIYTTFYIWWFTVKNKPDIIHIHSNEFIPAAVIVSKINNKKSIVTIRDYQILCNLGFCLWHKDLACQSIVEYLKKDFSFFYQNYSDRKSLLKYIYLQAAAIRGWFMQKIIKYFARQIDFKIAVSQKVSQVFTKNKFLNLHVINNPILIHQTPTKAFPDRIIYVGKLSPGKGVNLLLDAFIKVQRNLPDLKLLIVGSGILESKLLIEVKKHKLSKKVEFMGQVNHDEVLDLTRRSSFAIVPSVWPEPLPRSALETLLSGVPVIASARGGTKEAIKQEYGIIIKPNVSALNLAILQMVKHRALFKKNILKDLIKLKRHYSTEIADKYEKVYKKIL